MDDIEPRRVDDANAGDDKQLIAYQHIRSRMADGDLAPGARLKEVELAAALKISRTPVREAIRQLEREGAVTIVPNRGAIVREMSEQEIEDTYDLRAVLEGHSASRAAVRMDPRTIARLDGINTELQRLIDSGDAGYPALIRLNAAFHATIVEGSGNRRIGALLELATELPLAMKRAFWESDRARAMAAVYHREIVEAIRARDAVRAEAVMRSHVYSIKDFYTHQHREATLHSLVGD